MYYFFSLIIGGALGSIPSGWILLKYIHSKDITKEGSGNVGAMNSYEVSGSKLTGVLVLIIDLLKGFLSVFLCHIFFGAFVFQAIALIMAVFTHCFNPFLKFKGGRGLATAAGGALILCAPVILIWVGFYGCSKIINRNVHFCNFIASVCSLLTVLLFPDIIIRYTFTNPPTQQELALFTLNVFMIILIRHFEPIVQLIEKNKE